jgi:vitamin B12 transporter
MNNGIRLVALFSAALACAVPALAEDAQVYELEPNLVVTPSRMAEPIDDALASVSVLTRTDIERAAAEDLPELLRLQPGVDVVRTGGPGSQVSVFLRGGNSNHVLVLIDGVRAASSNTGAYAWEHLPLNQVERIEIVRGPRGSLYGSDSIGGVIHVFTRDDPEPYARVTGGSYGTREFEGGIGYPGSAGTVSVNAGLRRVDGFSAQNPNGFSYHPDDDGFETRNLGIKGALETGIGDWRFSLLALDSETAFDEGESDGEQRFGSLAFESIVTAAWRYQLQFGYSDETLASDHGVYTTDFESRRAQLSWQNQYDTGPRSGLSFGLDYYSETGSSAGGWDEKRHSSGLFAAWDFHPGRWHLQIAGRHDDNSRFGRETTGQLAAGYALGEGWELSASYGSAFRGPNLNEQYSPGFGGLFAGNPDLEPESSTTAELGLRWRHAAGTLAAFIHRTDVDDLIAFNGEAFQAVNVDTARLEGLELLATAHHGNWHTEASLTLQTAKDRATGEALLRRPERKGSITLDYRFEDGSWLGLEWFHSGARMDYGGVILASYDLLNLRAGWRLTPSWSAELRGENLLDEDWEPARGFNAAGRSCFISVSWRP